MLSKFNQFNEKLKADTYRSAADKLHKMGHESRSKKLYDHVNRSISEHVFNIWIFSSCNWSQATQKWTYKKINETPIQGKLHSICHDNGSFEDAYHNESEDPLWISISFKIDPKSLIHVRDRDFNKMKECGFIRSDNILEIFNLQPYLGQGGKFKTNGQIGIETINSEFIGKFSDRKSAIEFKKALRNVLFNKTLHYGYDRDEHTDELITSSDSIRNDLLKAYEDSNLDDVESLYYSLCNINTNLLYSEDGIWKDT